jgi:hypothetical protein
MCGDVPATDSLIGKTIAHYRIVEKAWRRGIDTESVRKTVIANVRN